MRISTLDVVAGIVDAGLLKHGAPGPGSSIPATVVHRHFLLDKLRELLGDFTHMNTRIQSILIVLMLLFLGFLPQMQAVSPAPDGCYPGFTTAEGCNALKFLTTGAGNTGVGWYSLYVNTTGNYNTGVGAGTLILNTAIGYYALQGDTTGGRNTAVGGLALYQNTSGTFNVAIGVQALSSNTEGGGNIALGFGAGDSVTTANNVICIGASGENVNASC